jgi:hypothetical protein
MLKAARAIGGEFHPRRSRYPSHICPYAHPVATNDSSARAALSSKSPTASAPAETFSVTNRLTSLRAEETPAAIFIARALSIIRATSPPPPPTKSRTLFPFLYGMIKSSSPQESRRNFSCASCWGYLTALLVAFPFTLAAI